MSLLLVCQSELLWSVVQQHWGPGCKPFTNQGIPPERFRTCQRLLRRASWRWSLVYNRSYVRHPRTLAHHHFQIAHVSSTATMLFPLWTLAWHGSLTRLPGRWNISSRGASFDSRQLLHISLHPKASHRRWHLPSDLKQFSSSFCLSMKEQRSPRR